MHGFIFTEAYWNVLGVDFPWKSLLGVTQRGNPTGHRIRPLSQTKPGSYNAWIKPSEVHSDFICIAVWPGTPLRATEPEKSGLVDYQCQQEDALRADSVRDSIFLLWGGDGTFGDRNGSPSCWTPVPCIPSSRRHIPQNALTPHRQDCGIWYSNTFKPFRLFRQISRARLVNTLSTKQKTSAILLGQSQNTTFRKWTGERFLSWKVLKFVSGNLCGKVFHQKKSLEFLDILTKLP